MESSDRVINESDGIPACRVLWRLFAEVRIQVEVALVVGEALLNVWQGLGHVKLCVLRAAVALNEEDHIWQLVVLLDDVGKVGRSLVTLVGDGLELDGVLPPSVCSPHLHLRLLSELQVIAKFLLGLVAPVLAPVVHVDNDVPVKVHLIEPGQVLHVRADHQGRRPSLSFGRVAHHRCVQLSTLVHMVLSAGLPLFEERRKSAA
mmetsp:Transcript_104957/g.338456  ORF Transcript_104957/g.338456 Transcript_104957/m.338456 type:complete len:204 (-) Transcript_104957:135-746(-)